MSTEMQTKVQASLAQSFTAAQTGLLQRKSTLCNTPGLVEDSGRDKEKLTLQRSSVDQAGTTTVPRFGHDFSRVSVHGTGLIQTKLKINEPGDIYEQEADMVADAMMRMAEPEVQREVEPEEEERLQSKPLINQITPLVQRQPDPTNEEEEEEETIQAKPLAGLITPLIQRQSDPVEEEEETIQPKSNTGMAPQVTPGVAHDIHSLKGTGQPLPASERTFFEPRFGRDFSNVRVHTNERAARTAQTINARAFTLGSDVVFGAGQYSPSTISGRRLLAHELTHVVQQRYSTKGIQRRKIKKWFSIRYQSLKGKKFHLRSDSYVTVQVKSRYVRSPGTSRTPSLSKYFSVKLKKYRWGGFFDKSMGKKLYPIASHSETWIVPKGKYYLEFDIIGYSHPYWILEGDVLITIKKMTTGRILSKALQVGLKKEGSAYFRGNKRLEVSKSGKTGSCKAFGSNKPPPNGKYCIRRRGEAQRDGFLQMRAARNFWYLFEPQFRTPRSRLNLHYGTSTIGCINVPSYTCYFSKIVPILDQPGLTRGIGYDGYPPGNKEKVKNKRKKVNCVAWLYVK